MKDLAHTRNVDGRRPGDSVSSGRRRALAVALGLGAAVVLAAAPAAQADNSGQQVVATVYPGGAQESVTIGQLESACTAYTGAPPAQNSGGSSPGESISASAWTLTSVLGCLQPTPIVPAQVTSVVVIDQQGQPQNGPGSVLSPADLGSPSDFLNPDESPLIFSDGTNIIYERPQRTATDLNAADQVQVPSPQPFALEVFEQPALQVAITASSTSIAAGQRVRFSVTGVPAGDQATYSWNFGGGATNSSSPTPNLIFSTAGVWPVTLTVTDATAGSVGVASTTITVGAATPTKTSTTPVKVGPTKGKGGSVGAPTRTTKKPTTAPGRTTPTKTTPPKTTPTRTTTAPTRTRTTRTTPTHTVTAPKPTHTVSTPAVATTPGPGGAGGTSSGGKATTPNVAKTPSAPTTPTPAHTTAAPPVTTPKPTKHKPKPTPPPKPKPHPTQTTTAPQPAKPSGQRVSGLLLASLSPVPAGKSPLAHPLKPAAVTAAPLSAAPGHSPWAVVAGVAAAVLLLALGAVRELGVRLGGRRGGNHD